MPTAPSTLLTDQTGIESVLGAYGVQWRLDVDKTTVVSATEQLRLTLAINIASDMVINSMNNRYSVTAMAASYMVYWWASVVGAYNLSMFSAGSVNAALQSEYETTMQWLMSVDSGSFRPAGMKSLSGSGAHLDNIRLDPRFRTQQARKQPIISETTPQRSPERVDIDSQYIGAIERDR